jgi:hypothetical protein
LFPKELSARRLGVSEKIIKILQASEPPKLPVAKAIKRSTSESKKD